MVDALQRVQSFRLVGDLKIEILEKGMEPEVI